MTRKELREFLGKWKNALDDAKSQADRSKGRECRSEELQKTAFSPEKRKKALEDDERRARTVDLWEGQEAYKELQKAGLWEAVAIAEPLWDPVRKWPKDWRAHLAIQEISSEIQVYRDHVGKVVKLNSSFRHADEFLMKMSKRFEKEARQSEPNDVKRILQEYAKNFEKTRRRLEWVHVGEIGRIWERPPGAMGEILISHKYKKKRPTREVDLDMLFQIRLALILRTFLPKAYSFRKKVSTGKRSQAQTEKGINLQTIARLVVLVYIVAALAKETDDGHLLIAHNRKELVVQDVEQRLGLERAGIDQKQD